MMRKHMIYIKKRRERVGKTMKQLADAVGVTDAAIAQYESGQCMPKAEVLPKLARALGCTIDELYREEVS